MIATVTAALGWSLLYFVWQALLVGLGAAVLLRLLRGASARWRYGVCALALLLCLAMPALHLGYLLGQGGHAAAPVPSALLLQAWLPTLVLAWSAGVAVMAARLLFGLSWVGQLRRQAEPAPPLWQQRLDALAQRMGLQRAITLKLHAGLSTPVTVGFWRPLVLLPASLLSGMPVPLLEALLAHELAHVRRWDYLVNLLQSVAEALLFFHPVVWWLSGRMRIERELVADELAAVALQDPQRLAHALHALSQQPAPVRHGLLMSARGGLLLARIQQLLAPQPATPAWKLAMPALLVACATVAMQVHGHTEPARQIVQQAALPKLAQLPALSLSARHMLVLDDTGRVLMARDADAIVPIASITKLMTAMVVLEAGLDLQAPVKIIAADGRRGGQSVLPDGAVVPRGVALQLALLPSENRAAAALARTYPGGQAAFLQALQGKIASLGLRRTHLQDAVGLSPGNTSTAAEVAVIVAAAARYPDIARLSSERQASVQVQGRSHLLHNTNALVGQQDWQISLSKTGSSKDAGSCVTMRMLMGNGARHVTVVLLDAENSQHRSQDAQRIRAALAVTPI
ncbi:M56 family metallopeptidase [Janthinobacterium aquaticum]|uniref:M56 family metallopeptidase n=1 Tax=Janthinobacterium sp. FT58W TaxID=2654254 RepID=UPI001263F09B|nr:M56 family metallopeptidase [Janthinobacterium sp. FT58W]KAB8044358.1 hypothetical protein GCM43_03895 [Janthinobacterium sp. FT58W]